MCEALRGDNADEGAGSVCARRRQRSGREPVFVVCEHRHRSDLAAAMARMPVPVPTSRITRGRSRRKSHRGRAGIRACRVMGRAERLARVDLDGEAPLGYAHPVVAAMDEKPAGMNGPALSSRQRHPIGRCERLDARGSMRGAVQRGDKRPSSHGRSA